MLSLDMRVIKGNQDTRSKIRIEGLSSTKTEEMFETITEISESIGVDVFLVKMPSWCEVQFPRDSAPSANDGQQMRDVLGEIMRRM